MKSPRDILNRARWSRGDLHELSVHVVHRGAPDDRRVIGGARIIAVHATGIELSPETEYADAGFVPYHRFLAIVGAEGELWARGAAAAGPAAGAVPVAPPAAPTEAAGSVAAAGVGSPVSHTAPVEIDPAATTELSVLVASAGDLLVLDGSVGEGGGQILRSSLSLSMLLGRAFVLKNIRQKRRKPGLMRQHLAAVKAAAAICDAELVGAELGSTELTFRPGALRGGEHRIDIGSAGALALVVQTIALPLALAPEPSTVRLRGGTHVPLTPIAPFLLEAWLPKVREMGAKLELELAAVGFNPAGGGELTLRTEPSGALTPMRLERQGELAPLELTAIVAELSESVARRELQAAAEELVGCSVRLRAQTVASAGPGNAFWILACDGAGNSNVFSAIGESGRPAEQVAHEATQGFRRWQRSGAAVEEHLADQLMLPLALAGAGSFTCSEWSLHARTNLSVLRSFMSLDARAWRLADGTFRFEIAGAG